MMLRDKNYQDRFWRKYYFLGFIATSTLTYFLGFIAGQEASEKVAHSAAWVIASDMVYDLSCYDVPITSWIFELKLNWYI